MGLLHIVVKSLTVLPLAKLILPFKNRPRFSIGR